MAGQPDKIQTALTQAAVPTERHPEIQKLVEDKIGPHLQWPATDAGKSLLVRGRFLSEFSRSFLLSVLTLLWFFIVPIPGLLVLSAWDYRVSLSLSAVIWIVLGAVGFAILFSWIGRTVEWFLYRGITGRRGLRSRIDKAFRQFQALTKVPGALAVSEVSSLFALFTDAQTYVDQRSYAYARYSVELIERKLSRAPPLTRP
jgi:hypothetical protein